MKIIAADDETLAREMLTDAIAGACPDAELYPFAKPSEVLAFAQQTPCDIAFLDIRMRGMDGVELARRIKELTPNINIIFVTGYDEYAADAMSMHASGYIIKPVTKDKVQRELSDLRYPVSREEPKLLRVQCFGNFEVYAPSGESMYFKRSKAKELFAYLVHRQGACCTIREIAAVLFEDTPYDMKQQSYMQTIVFTMMHSLKSAKAEQVVRKQYNSLSLDVSRIDCDYYRFCQQPEGGGVSFRGEYMSQYAWAEHMTGYLERQRTEE